MEIVRLDDAAAPAWHRCLLASFEDYVLPVEPTLAQWRHMLRRRGADPALSFGVLRAGEPAGLAVHGRRGELGYCVVTGVRPFARGQGVGVALMEAAAAALRDAGATKCRLEVIQGNRAAELLYERLGFVRRRELWAWILDGVAPAPPRGVDVADGPADPDALLTWADHEPSWQNAPASLAAIGDRAGWLHASVGGQRVGLAAVVPAENDLPLLAVHPDHRRRGVGGALLAAAQARCDPAHPVKLVNADPASPTFGAFCRALGLRQPLRQWEMDRVL